MTSSNKKNLIIPLILVAAVLIYSLMGNSLGSHLDFGTDALTVSASDMDWVIAYDQIVHMELTDLPDVGRMTEGIDKATLQCGSWENGTWGSYTLCISPKISRCIVLTLADESIFVLNYESADSTGTLYDMFTELLQSRQTNPVPEP